MVVLGGLVLAFLDMHPARLVADLGDRLGSLSASGVCLAFAAYAASYLGRAVRLMVLLPGARGLLHLASVSARHNFLNLVLPFRSGEVALPWMLKQEAGRPLAEGTAALVVARVLDLLCVAAYFTLGLMLWGAGTDTARTVSPRVGAVLGVLLVILGLLRPVAHRLARVTRFGEGRLASFVTRAAGHLDGLPTLRLAGAVAVSLATWALTYLTFWLLVRDMGDATTPLGQQLAGVGFARSLVGSTGLHLTTVLPVNTPAGAGVWEAGWIFGYDLLAGLGKQAAGVSAVISHLAIFAFITVLAGVGWLLRRRPAPEAAPPADPGHAG